MTAITTHSSIGTTLGIPEDPPISDDFGPENRGVKRNPPMSYRNGRVVPCSGLIFMEIDGSGRLAVA